MRHLDQNGLAERWRVSGRTLEQWRWQGKGPRYLKIGGRVVYRVEDVEAFEAANLHVNTIGPIDERDVQGTSTDHRHDRALRDEVYRPRRRARDGPSGRA
jgi:hypothetical protein